jgi:2-polyprenyl-3-methyl-5-hydroxy-6-metoxy-1,4-benzoquinol methylase
MRTRSCDDCAICGARGQVLYRDLADRFFSAPGQWQLARCPHADCGLAWLNPMPMEEDVGLAYQTYFTHAEGKSNRLRRWFLAAYALANVIPSALTGLNQARRRMEVLFLDGLAPGRLLDVGCGDGRFLHAMNQRGWRGEGVDFDPQAVDRARRQYGLTVHTGNLVDAGYREDTFDAVTLRHVIEHVPDPVGLLRECRRILKRSGRLVVVTPNLGSLGHRQFGRNWMNLDPPRHLHLFSGTTLARCARLAGFENSQTLTTAANADVVFAVSLALDRRARHALDATARPELGRALKAVGWQYRENWRLRHDPEAGEESVLLATK